MTTQSHTELAARLREAHDLSLDGNHFDARVAVLEVVAALESPERVQEEAVGFTPPSDCDSRKLCTVNGRCAGRYDTKAICLTPPTAPAQDAQGVSAILDALRVGRVACEWAEKTAEVQQIAAAMEIAKSMLSATPSPQAEKQPLSDDEVLLGKALDLCRQRASVSFVQRKLAIGYNRAGQLLATLKERGLIDNYSGGIGNAGNVTKEQANDAR